MQIAFLSLSDLAYKQDLVGAIEQAGMTCVDFSAEIPSERLVDFSGYIIAGDWVNEETSGLTQWPWLQVIQQQSRLGKPILGVGQGAQVLIEGGLVPGLANNQVGLSWRTSQDAFLDRIQLSQFYQYNAFTRYFSFPMSLFIQPSSPCGYVISGPGLLAEMQANGLDLFYSDKKLMAVSNKQGNALALLPALDWAKSSSLFLSMREYIEKGYRQHVEPLFYQPR